MDRLTERDEYGNADIIALSDMMPELYAELSFSETNALTDALNRLAAYEDTELTPEEVQKISDETSEMCVMDKECFRRIMKYIKAKAEGRLIVLPVKVGNTVWYLTGIRRNIIKSATVERITIDCNGICDIHVKNEDGVEFWHEFDIFHLTREAAEAALKEAQQG